MTSNSNKTELLVGLFLLFGLALVIGAIFSIGDFSQKDKGSYPLRVVFKNVDNLIKGTSVRMGGTPIGVVSDKPDLSERGDSVIVPVRIREGIMIQRGAVFKIASQSILGDSYIDVVPPDPPVDTYYAPNQLIVGQLESDFSQIKSNALSATEEIVNILKKLDQNSNELIDAVAEITDAAKGIRETTRRINEGVLSDENLTHISSVMKNADAGAQEARLVLADFRHATAELEKRITDLDPAIAELKPTLKTAQSALSSVQARATEMKTSKGFFNTLIYDRVFQQDAVQFIKNLRDYGILRYRDARSPEPAPDPRSGFSGRRR